MPNMPANNPDVKKESAVDIALRQLEEELEKLETNSETLRTRLDSVVASVEIGGVPKDLEPPSQIPLVKYITEDCHRIAEVNARLAYILEFLAL